MKKILSRLVSTVLSVTVLATSLVVTPVSTMAAGFSVAGGWNETLFAEISGVKDANVTAVSYSGPTSGSLSGEDLTYLVRDTSRGVRVDIPGLKAGNYTLNITAGGTTYTQSNINVPEQDRSGFAHYKYSDGVGAYKDDGTLKANAKVIYVTDSNKDTVTVTSKDGTTVSGIGNILNSAGGAPRKDSKGNVVSTVVNTNQDIIRKLAQDGTPLVVRFIGKVTAPKGLTSYDSYDYGGSPGDNGYMARMQSGKNVTLEGIGYDAEINGWGIHFICQTAYTDLGKSFEVRNLTFWGSPEDSIGMEGQQSGSTITASVERIWIHNNSFLPQNISNPAESDKAEGDGCCDFKRGQYMTMSYNYFAKAHKTNLVGSSDSSLQYHITWHHNMWENCEARGPLGRQANMHIYNNYYKAQSSYAMNPRANCYIFSEYNTLEYCKNPMDVTSGGIKSFNDTLIACSGAMTGTFVTDKSTKVSTSNKYANFDTDSSVSYIPSGDYKLQTSAADAKATCLAYSGVMKQNVITEADVDSSIVSATNQPTASVALPFSATYGKNNTGSPTSTGRQVVNNVVYNATKIGTSDITIKGEGVVFNLAQAAKVTMTGTSGSYVPVLVDSTGKEIINTSGTATLPAGTYVIQSSVYDPGTGNFKEAKLQSLKMEKANPSEVVETTTRKVVTEATTETTTKQSSGNETTEEPTEGTTTKPIDPNGSAAMGTYVIGTGASGGDFNVTNKTATDGNVDFKFRSISTSDGSFRGDDGYGIALKLDSSTDMTLTISNKSVIVTNVATFAKIEFPVGTRTVTLPAGTYSIEGSDSGNNSKISNMVLASSGGTVVTEPSTESTTKSEQPTQSTTEKQTEATTQAQPIGSVNVSIGSATVRVDDEVEIPVKLTGANVAAHSGTVTFDANKLEFVSAIGGSANFDYNEVSNGTIYIADANGKTIGETICILKFVATKAGDAKVGVEFNELISTSDTFMITPEKVTSTITVKAIAVKGNGDVYSDGVIDDKDAAELMRYIMGASTSIKFDISQADCNGVEGIDSLDVIWILNNKSTGSEIEIPVGNGVISQSMNIARGTNDGFVTVNNDKNSSGAWKIDKYNSSSAPGYIKFTLGKTAKVALTTGGEKELYISKTLGDSDNADYTMSAGTKEGSATLSAGTYYIFNKSGNHTIDRIVVTMDGSAPEETTKKTESTTESTTKATTTTTTTTTTEKPTESTTSAPVAGNYNHSFDANDTSSSFYTIAGNTSTSKGTATYNGTTYEKCLKMESGTDISFNGGGTLVLVFDQTSGTNGYTVKLDGEAFVIPESGVLVIEDVYPTFHEITKGAGSSNLFYMSLQGSGTVVESSTETTTETTTKATTTTTEKPTESTTSAPVAGNYNHSFDANGTNSSFYTIAGNTSDGKGTATYNGTTYTNCLKMESSTSVKFNGGGTLLLVFDASDSTRTIKLDGTAYTIPANGILTINNVSKAAHEITKGSGSSNLFYMSLQGSGTIVENSTETTTKKTESSTETTTKSQGGSSGDNANLTDTSSLKTVATIKSNSSSDLTNAIKTLNSSGGKIVIDTPTITLSSTLTISGSKAGAIVGVKQSDGSYPVLNFEKQSYSDSSRGIKVSGSNQIIQNIIVEKAGDNGIWVSGAKNVIEHVITRYNSDSGIQLSDNADGNTLRYCYSYRNCDTKTYGANADGFAPKLGATNTVFEYCYAWDNSDDGWDSYDKSGDKSATVTYKHSACWNNGNTDIFSGAYDEANNFYYGKSDPNIKIQSSSWLSTAEGEMNGNGFKFGSKTTEKSSSIVRTADYCVAFDHKSKGFDNNNSESCTGNISNCVSFQNNINYQLPYTFKTWKNNYSWSPKKSDQEKQSQTLLKPSNTSTATNTFYAVRDKIIEYVYQNKMPDDYGVNFDSAINSLK